MKNLVRALEAMAVVLLSLAFLLLTIAIILLIK